jgi:hypothetical protein
VSFNRKGDGSFEIASGRDGQLNDPAKHFRSRQHQNRFICPPCTIHKDSHIGLHRQVELMINVVGCWT